MTRKRESGGMGMHSHHCISSFRYMKDYNRIDFIYFYLFSQDSLLIIADDGDDVTVFPTSVSLTEYG